jgi:hypothetical protein
MTTNGSTRARTRSGWVRVAILAAVLFSARAASPCSVVGGIPSPGELVRTADAIIRATAVGYDGSSEEKYDEDFLPHTRIRFNVHEALRGTISSDAIVLRGFLVNKDDFNDGPVPRTFVRSAGRSGNCFADDYRRGGQFLLFLRRTNAGVYTVRWSPLAPLNEQLGGDDDPWLAWVRAESRK